MERLRIIDRALIPYAVEESDVANVDAGISGVTALPHCGQRYDRVTKPDCPETPSHPAPQIIEFGAHLPKLGNQQAQFATVTE